MAKKKAEAVPMEEEVEVSKELIVTATPEHALSFVTNFEDVKKVLTKRLAEYQGVKITDENIERFKLVKREIVSLRTMITSRQKETLDMYVKLPENTIKAQFAELLTIVAKTEDFLQEQLDVFDEERAAELTVIYEEYVGGFQKTYALKAENLAKVELKKSYYNKTAKEKEVIEDIEEQFKALKVIEDNRASDEKMIRNACKDDVRLNPEMFIKQLDLRSASAIVNDISDEKDRLKNLVTETPAEPVQTVGEKPNLGIFGKSKPASKTMRIEITYPDTSSLALSTFFDSHPEIKVKGIK